MRITIDIDDKVLHEVQDLTGIEKKSPAINRALEDYLRRVRKTKLIEKVMDGSADYSATNEELEARSLYDTD